MFAVPFKEESQLGSLPQELNEADPLPENTMKFQKIMLHVCITACEKVEICTCAHQLPPLNFFSHRYVICFTLRKPQRIHTIYHTHTLHRIVLCIRLYESSRNPNPISPCP